jgi:hypothetical protein
MKTAAYCTRAGEAPTAGMIPATRDAAKRRLGSFGQLWVPQRLSHMLIRARYLTLSRLGVYQYRRRVPKGHEGQYGNRTHIIQSLRTRDTTKAAQEAVRLAAEHDALWGCKEPPPTTLHSQLTGLLDNQVRLSDALSRYLGDHTKGNQPTFRRDTERALGLVFFAVGDIPLEALTRERARSVLEVMVAKGNSKATVQRQLAIIRARASVRVLRRRAAVNPL